MCRPRKESRRTMQPPLIASYAAWPRRDRRRSLKVLASSIRVIYQATLFPPHAFFMQVTKYHPHHDHIHASTHRLWRSSGTSAFIVVFSSCVPRVSTTTSRSSPLHILTHADLSFVVFLLFFPALARLGTSGFLAPVFARYCVVPARNVLLVRTALKSEM